MRKAACVLAAALAGCGSSVAPQAPAGVGTAKVERADLFSSLTLTGTLTYEAREDGSPYIVVNRAGGTYTELPAEGDRVKCGDVLYRVDDRPVLLLCGTVPAYRGLGVGDTGRDVRQLNENLRALGHAVQPRAEFTVKTAQAVRKLTGRSRLALGDAVFLPEPVRIAKVDAEPGAPARPGTPLAQATSDTLQVQVNLEASQQGAVKRGDRATVTLPGNTTAAGVVDRLGRAARTDDDGASATIPAYIHLDDPKSTRGLDRAPVRVEIATEGVHGVLSVPVLALVGKPGGGFAVERVRGGRRELVPVRVGLFDGAAGRVEVDGELVEGDDVVVPAL